MSHVHSSTRKQCGCWRIRSEEDTKCAKSNQSETAITTFEPEISITQLNSCSRARTGSCNKTIIPLSLIDLCVNTVKKTRPMESYIKQYKLLIHGVYLEFNMPSLHFGFNLFFSTYTTTNTWCPIPKVEGTGCDGHGV